MTVRMLRRYTQKAPAAQLPISPNDPNVRAGLGRKMAAVSHADSDRVYRGWANLPILSNWPLLLSGFLVFRNRDPEARCGKRVSGM